MFGEQFLPGHDGAWSLKSPQGMLQKEENPEPKQVRQLLRTFQQKKREEEEH